MPFQIPGDPVEWPGNPEPVDGKCNARLGNKFLRELAATGRTGMPTCYCGQTAGSGTPHKGTGTCKLHLGNARTQIAKADRAIVEQTLAELVAELDAPPPLRDPFIELWELAAITKQWQRVCQIKMGEIQDMVIEDKTGVEHPKAIIDLFQQALDRSIVVMEKLIKNDIRRKVQGIREDHARLIGGLVQSVWDDPRLELTDRQVEMCKIVFREKFPSIAPLLELDDVPTIDAEGWEDDDAA